jgi:hypothetical protein
VPLVIGAEDRVLVGGDELCAVAEAESHRVSNAAPPGAADVSSLNRSLMPAPHLITGFQVFDWPLATRCRHTRAASQAFIKS